MRRGAPHCGALQPCAPQKKKAGPAGRGDVRRAGGGSGGPDGRTPEDGRAEGPELATRPGSPAGRRLIDV